MYGFRANPYSVAVNPYGLRVNPYGLRVNPYGLRVNNLNEQNEKREVGEAGNNDYFQRTTLINNVVH